MKAHLKDDGSYGICRAIKRSCPKGGDEEHKDFVDETAMQKYNEMLFAETHGNVPSVKAKTGKVVGGLAKGENLDYSHLNYDARHLDYTEIASNFEKSDGITIETDKDEVVVTVKTEAMESKRFELRFNGKRDRFGMYGTILDEKTNERQSVIDSTGTVRDTREAQELMNNMLSSSTWVEVCGESWAAQGVTPDKRPQKRELIYNDSFIAEFVEPNYEYEDEF